MFERLKRSPTAARGTMPGIALVVDDEPHIRRAVRNTIEGDFDRVIEAAGAVEAVDLAAAYRPDLIVLDLLLPDRSGQWVCAELRRWTTVPIIVLSVLHSEAEKIRILDEGADDFVTKPFSPAELLARAHAQVRRARRAEIPGDEGVIRIGGLVIDPGARTVRRDGRDVHLTPTEWALLRAFLKDAGKTLTHRRLFTAAWATSAENPQQYLRVYVAGMRRKLEPDPVRPTIIVTEPGVGYRLQTE